MKINKYYVLAFSFLIHSCLAMEKPSKGPVDYQKVYKSEKLRRQFDAKKFLLLAAVITKQTGHVEKILHGCPTNIAAALANQLHQNVQYQHLEENRCKDESWLPLFQTINPFFKALTIHEKDDLDCATPLELSTFLGDTGTIQALLAHNAEINGFYGHLGYAPLHIAVKYKPEVIPFLISRGANVELRARGDTPVMVACQKDGKYEALKPLLDAKASLLAKTHLESSFWLGSEILTLTPLHIACNNNQDEKVRFLLQTGAPVDEPDLQGRTPLHWTVANGHHGIALLLLNNGANTTRRSADGKSLIEQIPVDSRYPYRHILDLLRYGAPYPQSHNHQQMIDAELTHDYSLLRNQFLQNFIRSLIRDESQPAQQLLSVVKGNQLNECDDNGMTPLFWAVCRSNAEVVARIVALQQKSPLQSIALSLPIISSQVLQPINMSHKDNSGRTAIDWARWLKSNEIAQLLEKAVPQ